ncbi:hypothetical protein DFH09DRAFT_1318655 [Mycena vulgaris]|nr:hypothetical protein DFH09DRAFT_1318655 [Mycena vulgaris]
MRECHSPVTGSNIIGLNVDNHIVQDHNLLCDMYDNYLYGTLAQKTRMERLWPGSLSKLLENTLAFKGRTRVCAARFKTTTRLKLRKPVLRMAYVKEVHSNDEHTLQGRVTEEYRQRNAKPGQNKPHSRRCDDPLLSASELSRVLPPEVPMDFFTPEFYNSLMVKERARYAKTGVAFPLAEFVFNPAHSDWKKMGKVDFMKAYGNQVLALYNVPSAAEIAKLSNSDADDDEEEEEETDLADTDDSEMEVDEELQS